MPGELIRVMIVEDQAMVRRGLKAFLSEFENICVVAEAANGLQAVTLVARVKPDIVLLDLLMPGMDGIETIKRILVIQPNQRIIILTAFYQEDKLLEAVQAGAFGLIRKDAPPERLIHSIQKAYQGEPIIDPGMIWKILRGNSGAASTKPALVELSDREIEVLRLLSKGFSDHKISEELVLPDVTISTHVSRILSKLGLRNRVEAVLYGIRSGMVQFEELETFEEIY